MNSPKRGDRNGFALKGISPVDDLRDTYDFEGDLADIYGTKTGRRKTKWHHYIPVYDRYLCRYRGHAPKMLEIGVFKGGSLDMWRSYLGEGAVLFGVDINEACARFDGISGSVRIGSQDDPDFLNDVVAEMGGLDIVLDDGSHQMAHIKTSLETLFPQLNDGGIYIIEDLHICYRPKWGGGLDAEGNFYNYLRKMIDDMHYWHHTGEVSNHEYARNCTAIHIYESICVIEKRAVPTPRNSLS